MGFEFGDVMADVIEEFDLFMRDVEDLMKGAADLVKDLLAVVKGEVSCSCHRTEVAFSQFAVNRRGDELFIGQAFIITLSYECIKSILADLMSKAARPGMDQDVRQSF